MSEVESKEMRQVRIERDAARAEKSALINRLNYIEKQSLLGRFSVYTPETVSTSSFIYHLYIRRTQLHHINIISKYRQVTSVR